MMTTTDIFFFLLSASPLTFFLRFAHVLDYKKIPYKFLIIFNTYFLSEVTMTDYTTSVEMQNRLLEHPLNETSFTTSKVN